LVLDKKSGNIKHDIFYNLSSYLKKGDVLVVNESKVTRCRLKGIKEKTGAHIECFVLNKLGDNQYIALIKPSKRIKPSDRVTIGEYYFIVKSKLDYGKAVVKFNVPAEIIFKKYGQVPLHFSKRLINKLKREGIVFARLTLDIGLDTFRPISVDEIEKHKIHSEYYCIEEGEAEKIRFAKNNENKIIAVGTTVVRVLETLMTRYGKITRDSGMTDIYIYPGYKFKAVDCMITNFHLPRSTLLVMVSAFTGRQNILNAYEEAKRKGYRFYSFGDCMLIK